MAPEFFRDVPLKGAMKLLPPAMDSAAARAMIIAICLQESRLLLRKQVGGPARGYGQFEQSGGVNGVLTHPASAAHTKVVCAALDVTATAAGIYTALEQNDILAAACARLLLWTLPDTLPLKTEPEKGWLQYMAAWRPGHPRKDVWPEHFAHAWALVEEAQTLENNIVGLDTIAQLAVKYVEASKALSAGIDISLVKVAQPSE